jgi:hypothetical protein
LQRDWNLRFWETEKDSQQLRRLFLIMFWITEMFGSLDHTCGIVLAFWDWTIRIVFKGSNNIRTHF